jgi:hypothetical protein
MNCCMCSGSSGAAWAWGEDRLPEAVKRLELGNIAVQEPLRQQLSGPCLHRENSYAGDGTCPAEGFSTPIDHRECGGQ